MITVQASESHFVHAKVTEQRRHRHRTHGSPIVDSLASNPTPKRALQRNELKPMMFWKEPTMTTPSAPNRNDSETTDEAEHQDETVVISEDQQALIDNIIHDERPPVLSFEVANDQENGIYTAVADDRAIGGVVYSLAGDRIVLQAASVHTEFRHQGVATELIRRVLDDVRTQGKTTTILCPIVQTFIEKHPEYVDLVDARRPGLMNRGHK